MLPHCRLYLNLDIRSEYSKDAITNLNLFNIILMLAIIILVLNKFSEIYGSQKLVLDTPGTYFDKFHSEST
jgi:hypothetical protein